MSHEQVNNFNDVPDLINRFKTVGEEFPEYKRILTVFRRCIKTWNNEISRLQNSIQSMEEDNTSISISENGARVESAASTARGESGVSEDSKSETSDTSVQERTLSMELDASSASPDPLEVLQKSTLDVGVQTQPDLSLSALKSTLDGAVKKMPRHSSRSNRRPRWTT